jgi:hypothetical protein
MRKPRVYEWWVEWEDVVEMLHSVKKTGHSITQYLIETFNLEIPCKIVLRPIVEEVC